MEMMSELSILMLYPSGFFLLFLLFFIVYYVLSIVSGLDNNLGIGLSSELNIDGFMPNLIMSMGFSKVPLSIGLTFTSFFGFVISGTLQLHVMSYFFDFTKNFNPFSLEYLIPSTVVLIVSLLAGLWLAGKLIKPLGRFFAESDGQSDVNYIGMTAKVRSQKVSNTFGEVVLYVENSEHFLTVSTEEEGIINGDKVVIIGYNESTKRFLITKQI